MAHYPTCHREKIWGKEILPDARLPRLSGDEHLPVIDVRVHGCVCMYACICAAWLHVGVSPRVRTGGGDCWFLGKQNYLNCLNNGTLKHPPDAHIHTHTHTHTHTQTHTHMRSHSHTVGDLACDLWEQTPEWTQWRGGESSCLYAAWAQCLPRSHAGVCVCVRVLMCASACVHIWMHDVHAHAFCGPTQGFWLPGNQIEKLVPTEEKKKKKKDFTVSLTSPKITKPVQTHTHTLYKTLSTAMEPGLTALWPLFWSSV